MAHGEAHQPTVPPAKIRPVIAAVWAAFGAFLASAVLVPLFHVWSRRRDDEARERADRERTEAIDKERARLEKEATLSARDETAKLREDLHGEDVKRRDELRVREARLAGRED